MGRGPSIEGRKNAEDARRGKLFTKFIREITVAARTGGADPASNSRLRLAMDKALHANMSKDTLERAIKRGSGEAGAEHFEEVRYEGYAPGGVAIIIEALTDNRNRTAGEVRSYFTKAGGSLAETGAVSFLFDRVGLIAFPRNAGSEEDMMEAAIEAGAEDVRSSAEGHEIITTLESLREVAQSLEVKFGAPSSAGLIWKPQNTITVDDETGEIILRLVGTLEDNDDVQNVYANFEVSDTLVAKFAGS